jgi:pimeloyl-ACP methyl ester carboxylesterase
MRLIFSHGKESGPRGFKIRRLAPIAEAHGCRVDSIDYQDCADPEQRVERLLARVDNPSATILVGSSMGGYVSLVASASLPVSALFLMAPALYIASFRQQHYPSQAAHIEIVHGWADEVIPAQNSIDYAREADCTLHLVRGDHPLNESIAEIESLFEGFLSRVMPAAAG